ncbi:class I SAM-dependent methyltransferase [Stakelama tenebrarum]|uniref:Class I SAM-dependent methyltransferase n=1 Tax=Stakelama tenebrarum TaxID=2711215 RepID=A0A6G6Y363_9SPHN|nr:class I SAM-dependent methyltransferase [Sphingosinithalassobacter tenebrarum]QIG79247.1 class I SAM-dependent methyltransferase [Sphingosinithalassobacter tenebrarum]
MRQIMIAAAIATTAVAVASVATGAPATQRDSIRAAVEAPTRTPDRIARDRYRHPVETLNFFGVGADDTVVEIWPGGGWYTEILAPYLSEQGQLWVTAPGDRGFSGIHSLQETHPETYGSLQTAIFPAGEGDARVPDGSADVVLTFRNVHNWRMGYQRDGADYSPEAFAQMFAMLRPGGMLGVVDHRLPEDADAAREESSGYIKVSTVRALAEGAGFEYVGASEVNANPADSADWERGVWTLPPTLAKGDADRQRYLAIGESDRMTLKFRKPD